ncbi:hypothetical protein BDQ17DRAFT_1363487 [Cyathus striatus]|nr:hypothetical protein BDQ17DRAFT_1363487 [Cyathus striatus]
MASRASRRRDRIRNTRTQWLFIHMFCPGNVVPPVPISIHTPTRDCHICTSQSKITHPPYSHLTSPNSHKGHPVRIQRSPLLPACCLPCLISISALTRIPCITSVHARDRQVGSSRGKEEGVEQDEYMEKLEGYSSTCSTLVSLPNPFSIRTTKTSHERKKNNPPLFPPVPPVRIRMFALWLLLAASYRPHAEHE